MFSPATLGLGQRNIILGFTCFFFFFFCEIQASQESPLDALPLFPCLLLACYICSPACSPSSPNSWTHHHPIFLLVVTEVAWGQLFPQQLTKNLDEEESDIVPYTALLPPHPPPSLFARSPAG